MPQAGLGIVLIDHMHVRRGRPTGIERYAIGLGKRMEERLPGRVRYYVERVSLLISHLLLFPLYVYLTRPMLVVCSVFPPSPLLFFYRRNVAHVVHDLFLAGDKKLLNFQARHYLRPVFGFALKHFPRRFTNSAHTRAKMIEIGLDAATIRPLRPFVENVFGLLPVERRLTLHEEIRLVAIGTIEPRKNYPFLAQVIGHLRTHYGLNVSVTIIGRQGWETEIDSLRSNAGVQVAGYLADDNVAQIIDQAHFYVSLSLDEGLGLPLLEVQYGGIPLLLSDIPAYREVAADTAIFVPLTDAAATASTIHAQLDTPGLYDELAQKARRNVERWNGLAAQDLSHLLALCR